MLNSPGRYEEKRRNVRKPCSRPTEFFVGNLPYHGTMRNISIEGVYIATPQSFSSGQVIRLKFRSSKDGSDIQLTGEVVRNDIDGIGVRFKH